MQINPMDNNSDHFLSCSFECPTCVEKFVSNEDFVQHIHEKHKDSLKKNKTETPVECPVCFVKFTQKNNLGRHMQRFHGAEAPRSYLKNKKNGSLPQCPECDIKFTRRSNLIRHLQKFHESVAPAKVPQKPKVFSCTECDTKFTKWTNCMRHIRCFHSAGTGVEKDQPSLEVEGNPAPEDLECVIEVDPFPVASPLRVEPASSESTECSEKHEPSPVIRRLRETTSAYKRKSAARNDPKLNPCLQTRLLLSQNATLPSQPSYLTICKECSITFSTPFNMRRHMKKFHCDEDTSPFSELGKIIDLYDLKKCPLCDTHENRLNLYVHLSLIHGLQVIIECQEFDSVGQLEEWLSQVKAEVQSSIQKRDSNRRIISCSKSSSADSENFCPSEMIISTEPGKCSVHYIKTHVGHES